MKRVCVVAILLCGAAVDTAHAKAILIDHNCIDLSVIPEDSVAAAASLRLLLRHASVGQGIDWGLDCLAGLKPTNTSCKCFAPGEYDRTNWILEARMGDGRSKIDDLVAQVSARADEFDVFTMKYCYIDALGDHHPDWEYYRTQMEQLEAQYPDKHFVWWTIPLTRDGQPGTDAFNALVRSYCGANGKILFDIADIECHDPSGVKQTNAQGDETICQDYTKESHAGHLNVEGRIRVASVLWRLMAAIADDRSSATDPHTIIYVDDDANAPGDGSSWETAYKFLQDALADAESAEKPVEIRVAQGVYRPDRSSAHPQGSRDRTATFYLLDKVTINGGFAGMGTTDPDARDIPAFTTILSGDLAANDSELAHPFDARGELTRADNCLHVLTCQEYFTKGVDFSIELNGLVITGGHAFLYEVSGDTPTTATPHEHRGGGLYVCGPREGDMTLIIRDCLFEHNYAEEVGGAGYCLTVSNMVFSQSAFAHNATDKWGGALHIRVSGVRLDACQFSRNWAGWQAGAAYIQSRDASLTACTFEENVADAGGAIILNNSTIEFTQCDWTRNRVTWGDAGAVQIAAGTKTRFWYCRFLRNSAPMRGGAIWDYGTATELTNCLFGGNTAGMKGGAIHKSLGQLDVRNCTTSGNRAPKGEFLCNNTRPEPSYYVLLANSILSEPDKPVWNEQGAMTIEYSDVRGGRHAIYDPNNAITWGPANTDVAPCFTDPGYWDPNGTADDPNDDFWVEGDYHLKSQAGRWDPVSQNWSMDDVTSPCIDTGDPNSPVDDEPEPNGSRINMGAYGGTAEASKSPSDG